LKLLLASSSPYRKSLLAKLGLSFTTFSPNIDESAHADESPESLVSRLAYEKATAAQQAFQEHIIIASDQLAYIKEPGVKRILTKPGDLQGAVEQLTSCSGKVVRFLTSLTCLQPANSCIDKAINLPGQSTSYEFVDVYFRILTDKEIMNYLQAEKPFDCAGSFKAEGLGITLFDKIVSSDPNTIVGLSLIAVNKALIKANANPLLMAAKDD
jgi:MAF protein